MSFSAGLAYVAAAVTAVVAIIGLYRDPRSFVHRVFTVGMALFALTACLTGFAYQATSIDTFLFRHKIAIVFASFLPGLWLLFSVSFARTNYSDQISKWKWFVLLAFVLPVSMVTLFYRFVLRGVNCCYKIIYTLYPSWVVRLSMAPLMDHLRRTDPHES